MIVWRQVYCVDFRLLFTICTRINTLKRSLENCNVAISVAKNEKRSRKIMDSKTGMLFKCGFVELGSCKVDKGNVVGIDNNYFDDGLIKLSKALRDTLAALVKKKVK